MSDERQRPRHIGWIIGWVVTLALAFLLGFQTGTGRDAGTTASPAGENAPAATPADTPDPEVIELLRQLPRRQADDPLALGSVDAPVVLTQWSDYRCPYCAAWSEQTLPVLQPFIEEGTLRVEHRDLAVLGEESVATAVAARAAGQQWHYWNYHGAVFAGGPEAMATDHSPAALVEFARTAGVPDLAAFEAALDDPGLRAAVEGDSAEAAELGITGTPFFVINTTVLSGLRPTADFVTAVEAHARD